MKKLLRLFMLAALFLPLALNAQNSWTVANGTTTHSLVPLDFYNCDGAGVHKAQMLYPESLLTDIFGNTIVSITFYHQNTSANKTVSASPWYILMGTTTETDLSTGFSTAVLDTVYSLLSSTRLLFTTAATLLSKSTLPELPATGLVLQAKVALVWTTLDQLILPCLLPTILPSFRRPLSTNYRAALM